MIKLPIVQVHEITWRLHANESRIQLLHGVSAQTYDLCSLKHILQAWWPRQVQEVPLEIQPYWNFHEISTENSLLLKGTIIITPTSQRQDLLRQLYVGHFGLSKCLHRTKQTTYWPGLYDHIYELLTNCQTCLNFSNNNFKQPPSKQLGHEVPLVLWSKLATDIFHFENCLFLVVVDYYSRFPFIRKFDRITPKHVKTNMQAIFSEHGWPDALVSDNGPCYNATEFRQAMEDMGVCHIRSSPHTTNQMV